MTEEQKQEQMTDDEAILKLAAAMKDNAPSQDEKHNVHSFLTKVVTEEGVERTSKLGNLRDDKELNELGIPQWSVRGCLKMARISDMIMRNDYFKDYFNAAAMEVTGTSLSREGFIIRQATTSTKQLADITKRKKINKGMFGSKKIEETGGDTTTNAGQSI